MAGEGYGEGRGEVFAEHLTIGKADEQRDSGHIGEVLHYFSTIFRRKVFQWILYRAGG